MDGNISWLWALQQCWGRSWTLRNWRSLDTVNCPTCTWLALGLGHSADGADGLEMCVQKASPRLFIKPFYALLLRNYHVFNTSVLTGFGEWSIEMWQLWTNEFRAKHKSQISPNDIVLSLQPQNQSLRAHSTSCLSDMFILELWWQVLTLCWESGQTRCDEATFIFMELDTRGAAITNRWAMVP